MASTSPVPVVTKLHPYVQYLKSTLAKIGRLGDLEQAIHDSINKDHIAEFKEWDITSADRFFQYASFLLNQWIPYEHQDGRFIYYGRYSLRTIQALSEPSLWEGSENMSQSSILEPWHLPRIFNSYHFFFP